MQPARMSKCWTKAETRLERLRGGERRPGAAARVKVAPHSTLHWSVVRSGGTRADEGDTFDTLTNGKPTE